MKTAWTFASMLLAAAIGLTVTSSSVSGADGIKLLVAASQAKANAAAEEIGTLGEGNFTSQLDGHTGAIRLGIDSQLLPYIEQDNLRWTIIDAKVDRDGTMTFTAYDAAAERLLVIEATPVAWHRTGEIAKMRGDYQILRLDARGNLRPVDQGTLGIIAILIG